MIELLAATALAPWAQPLAFRPLPGWQTAKSGTVSSAYGAAPVDAPKASTAWIAKNVRYRDKATADPPNTTLAQLPPRGIIVWAAIYQTKYMPRKTIKLDLQQARRLDCCEGAEVVGGMYELVGTGPGQAYAAIVRVYFGARASPVLRSQAQRALDRLRLPAPR